jgi:CO/xanthine dehydrogenase FAD-binding subunit
VVSVAVLLKMKENCSAGRLARLPDRFRFGKPNPFSRSKKVDLDLAKKCGELAAESLRPISDLRASADYRRQMCAVYVRKAICESVGLKDD